MKNGLDIEKEFIAILDNVKDAIKSIYTDILKDNSFDILGNLDRIDIPRFSEFLVYYVENNTLSPKIQKIIYNLGKYHYNIILASQDVFGSHIIGYFLEIAMSDHFDLIHASVNALSLEDIKNILINGEGYAYLHELILLRFDELDVNDIRHCMTDRPFNIYNMVMVGAICLKEAELNENACKFLCEIRSELYNDIERMEDLDMSLFFKNIFDLEEYDNIIE
jgi:hypothetical protein